MFDAIDLIDEDPEWRSRFADNVAYYKKGLLNMKLDIGSTASPIIPVKIGDAHTIGDVARLLLEAVVYAMPLSTPVFLTKMHESE